MLGKNNNGSSFLCLNSDKVVRTCVHLIFMSFLMTKEYTIATRVCLQQCPKFYRGLHYTQKTQQEFGFHLFKQKHYQNYNVFVENKYLHS